MTKQENPLLLACVFWLSGTVHAQTAGLTVQEAVRQALEKYPATQVSTEQASAAAAAITLARTAYLPRVDFLGQVNRATRNNIFGMLLPQTVLPTISGPPHPFNDLTSVWGSATGMLVSWEPFDFGFRGANVDAATAGRRRADAGVTRTRFEVSAITADAFLTLLAAQQTAVAAQAGVERSRVLLNIVEALVKAQLRPGADASRNRAELALAQTQLIQAQQAIRIARASLAQMLGAAPAQISVVPGPLLQAPQGLDLAAETAAGHPALQEQKAAIEEAQSRARVLDKLYYPRFNLQGASYARGTGARNDFTTRGGAAGLGPNIYNWGVGVTVTFPAFELFSIRARKEIEVHRERSEEARYRQILQDLNGNLEKAKAALEGALRTAEQTPIQLQAARDAEQQATARYRAGLGNLVDVAEAQRLVTQAEIDDSLARLNVWRGLLAVSAAQGDLDPFLQRSR
ncbi:MAG: TolC family protein [Bryobacteraceae bacterium]